METWIAGAVAVAAILGVLVPMVMMQGKAIRAEAKAAHDGIAGNINTLGERLSGKIDTLSATVTSINEKIDETRIDMRENRGKIDTLNEKIGEVAIDVRGNGANIESLRRDADNRP